MICRSEIEVIVVEVDPDDASHSDTLRKGQLFRVGYGIMI